MRAWTGENQSPACGNYSVRTDRAPAGWAAVTVSPSLSEVLKIGKRTNLQQAEHCYRTCGCIYNRQMRRTGTRTKGQTLVWGGGGRGRSCHASKSVQLSYLGFQFPFEVNTQQSRWRYERLNETRLSKYHMTSRKLLGVIQTRSKCCCRQRCTPFPPLHCRHTRMHAHKDTGWKTHTCNSFHKLSLSCSFILDLCDKYSTLKLQRDCFRLISSFSKDLHCFLREKFRGHGWESARALPALMRRRQIRREELSTWKKRFVL